MEQITRGIFCEDSYLGVTLGALIFPNGTIMIDAPLRGEDARSWRSILSNYREGSNRLLVCMDAHPDRSLGARAMETTIVAHKETAQVFHDRPTIFKGQGAETGAIWETYGDAIGMRWVTPDITFSKKFSLHWGDAEVVLTHRPGPTAGSIWVEIPDKKVVFIGDTVVPGQPPFLAYANLSLWLESIEHLLDSYRGYVIVSGRGGIVGEKDLKSQRNFLKKVARNLEKLADRNASLDATENLAERFLSDFTVERENREIFKQRLRNGLNRCYDRCYYSAGDENDSSQDNE